jgi:hypothetical protein
MEEKMKRLAVVSLLILLSVNLFAGGAQSPQAGAPPKIVMYQNSGAGNIGGGGTPPEDLKMVQDEILKQTGVLLEVIMQPPTNSTEKLAALLASGDQLDLWYGSWITYSDSGYIRSIQDLLKNAPITVATWEKWEAWGGVTDNKGNIWGVPRMTPMVPYPVFVREDYLKKLNLKMPATFNELESYLYAVQKADPFGNGQTIPLITRGTSLDALEWTFVAGFVKSGRANYLDPSDNKIKPLQFAPEYKEFLAKMAKWYADGIINRENIVWDVPTIREQIARGRVAATATWYSDVTLQNINVKKNVPGAGFNINDAGIIGLNGQKSQTVSKAGTTALMMSTKCKDPESAIRLIEWSYSEWEHYKLEIDGIEGVHWKYVDNDPKAKENKNTVLISKSGEAAINTYKSDYILSLGLPMETQALGRDADGTVNMHSYWLREKLGNFDSSYKTFEQNIFYNDVEAKRNIPGYDDINKYKTQELVKFFTGARPMSEWEKFLQEWKALGLDAWMTEYTRQYNLLK